LSNVLRTANFFGFREVFYIGGSKRWDRRGAVGVHNYIPFIYCRTVVEFFDLINEKYVPIALENNVEGRHSTDIMNFEWPINPVIIVGEEQLGLTKDILDRVNTLIEIPSLGTVRSMNVATAAGIAMFHYREQNWPLKSLDISLTK
jgi:tRNA G18 (ribose-2'-O)-methylase SpoU